MIKHCPHCASDRVYVQNGYIPLPDNNGWNLLVWCANCRAASGEYPTADMAITAWNLRDENPEYDFIGAYMGNPKCFMELDSDGQFYLLKDIAENLGISIVGTNQ